MVSLGVCALGIRHAFVGRSAGCRPERPPSAQRATNPCAIDQRLPIRSSAEKPLRRSRLAACFFDFPFKRTGRHEGEDVILQATSSAKGSTARWSGLRNNEGAASVPDEESDIEVLFPSMSSKGKAVARFQFFDQVHPAASLCKLLSAAWLAAMTPGAALALCSDLALVLSIDASGSVDDKEFALQTRGYAAAFRNREVLRALGDAGTVDLAAVVWGDADVLPQVLDWQRIVNADDAETFAERIGAIRRYVTGDTGLGAGVAAAIDLLEDDSRCAGRKLINVSGDGRESSQARPRRASPPIAYVRQRARDLDITINGLAIIDVEPDLAEYYRERLITGPGSFVMQIDSYHDFATAIIKKLVREIDATMLISANDLHE
jgi:hypothetical protein